jgi:heme/copper-type cytochrome/quinol oxidase subunit 1
MILPAFGIASHIIETFSRKQLFGYASMVWAMASIAILSFVVWAHHMFTVGLPLAAELFFMWATMLIAVPTGVKVFNWVTTMFKGSITYETPMLFAIAFVVLFTIGGFLWVNACNYSRQISNIMIHTLWLHIFIMFLSQDQSSQSWLLFIIGFQNGQEICMTKGSESYIFGSLL